MSARPWGPLIIKRSVVLLQLWAWPPMIDSFLVTVLSIIFLGPTQWRTLSQTTQKRCSPKCFWRYCSGLRDHQGSVVSSLRVVCLHVLLRNGACIYHVGHHHSCKPYIQSNGPDNGCFDKYQSQQHWCLYLHQLRKAPSVTFIGMVIMYDRRSILYMIVPIADNLIRCLQVLRLNQLNDPDSTCGSASLQITNKSTWMLVASPENSSSQMQGVWPSVGLPWLHTVAIAFIVYRSTCREHRANHVPTSEAEWQEADCSKRLYTTRARR